MPNPLADHRRRYLELLAERCEEEQFAIFDPPISPAGHDAGDEDPKAWSNS